MQPYINCIPKLDTMMSSVIELHTYVYQMRSALYPVRSESDIINKQRSQSTEQAKRARREQARNANWSVFTSSLFTFSSS